MVQDFLGKSVSSWRALLLLLGWFLFSISIASQFLFLKEKLVNRMIKTRMNILVPKERLLKFK